MSHKIAFCGYKGSGKSTLADILTDEYNFHEYAFANTLKQMIIKLFKIDSKYVYNTNFKTTLIPESNVTGRDLAQKIGTELFRNQLTKELPQLTLTGNSIWIHSLINDLKKESPDANIVISDCRFQNEYDTLKTLGYTIFKIQRDSIIIEDQHESELGCPYDYEIQNNGDIDDLLKSFLNVYPL